MLACAQISADLDMRMQNVRDVGLLRIQHQMSGLYY